MIVLNFYKCILLIFFIILCYGLKIESKNRYFNPLDSKQTKNFKGFFAIGIILHHLGFNEKLSPKSRYFIPKYYIGIPMVGIFFFFSGFGVMKNLLNNKNYLKGFLKKRLILVLIPFYLINTLYGILFYYTQNKYFSQLNPFCVNEKNKNLKFILTTFLGYTPAFENGWYIISVSLLYIVFYITFRFIKYHWINIIIIFIYTSWTILYGRNNYGYGWFKQPHWHKCTFCFLYGILIAKYEKQIINFLKKFYIIALPISIYIFLYICYYEKNQYLSLWITSPNFFFGKTALRKYIVQHIIYHLFCFSLINMIHIISMKIFFNNSILDHLGNISYEIYLYHTFFIYCLKKNTIINVSHDGFYVFLTFFFSLYTAKIMRKVNQFVISLFISKNNVIIKDIMQIKNKPE